MTGLFQVPQSFGHFINITALTLSMLVFVEQVVVEHCTGELYLERLLGIKNVGMVRLNNGESVTNPLGKAMLVWIYYFPFQIHI